MGFTSFAKLLPSLVLLGAPAALALPQGTGSACTTSHPLVGQTFSFLCSEYQVNGVVRIVDDCSLEVTGFNVVGMSAPKYHLFERRKTATTSDLVLSFNPNELNQDTTGAQIVRLIAGKTWNDVTEAALVPSSGPRQNIGIAGLDFTRPGFTGTVAWWWTIPAPTATATAAAGDGMTMTTAAPILVTPAPNATDPGAGAPNATGTAAIATIVAAPTVIVTLGDNKNYPNPPTQLPVSFRLQNAGDPTIYETPVLVMNRGTNYTFIVQAGATHPFYFTDSIEGARGNNPSSTEKRFAGGAVSAGNATAPFVLNFLPTSNEPDDFFYQCWNHRRMGWQVKLQGTFAAPAASNTPAVPISSDSRKSSAGKGIVAAMVVVAAAFLV